MNMNAKTRIRIQNFKFIRDIPYRIPLSRDEPNHCCEGKHTALYTLLEKTGLEVRPRICDTLWSDFDILPKEIQNIPHENEGRHLYLEVKIDGKWHPIDASLDKGLESVISVLEWDGKTSTGICVKPRHIYSPQESLYGFYTELSAKDFRRDMRKNGKFYKAINDWFETIRKREVQG